MKKMLLMALLMLSVNLVFADVLIKEQFSALCGQIKTTVPIVAFVMMLLGGIIYAAGQIMGAETRARANVWATALLTGGIIGVLIAASAPYLIEFFGKMFEPTGDWSTFSCGLNLAPIGGGGTIGGGVSPIP